jgi:putative adhesin
MFGRVMVGGLVLASLSATGVAAQDNWRVVSGDGWCNDRDGDRDRARYCEVRETTLRPAGEVAVDAAPNGGIQVTAGEGNDVRLEAKVMAVASTTEEARRLASQVTVRTSGTISAQGPTTRSRDWWTVSYRLTVPPRTDLDLKTHNGGITLTGVRGRTEFETMNGGVHVSDAGGSLRGRTTNGGVKVALTGAQWDGEGLDVTTTNGGVTLEVPADYNAHLETGTVNGGVSIDFPVRVQGRLNRQLSTDLGSGGPTIRAMTTNGGVKIKRR